MKNESRLSHQIFLPIPSLPCMASLRVKHDPAKPDVLGIERCTAEQDKDDAIPIYDSGDAPQRTLSNEEVVTLMNGLENAFQ